MFSTHGSAQDPSSLIPLILAVITAALVFWRTFLKLLTVGLVLMVPLGILDLLHDLH